MLRPTNTPNLYSRNYNENVTRSSVVAERPRDTPCRWKFC